MLEMASSVTLSGCEAPRVPMVEPAHPRQSYKGVMTRFPSLYRPHLGRVLPQSIVDPPRAPFIATITVQEILPSNGMLITAACCTYKIYK